MVFVFVFYIIIYIMIRKKYKIVSTKAYMVWPFYVYLIKNLWWSLAQRERGERKKMTWRMKSENEKSESGELAPTAAFDTHSIARRVTNTINFVFPWIYRSINKLSMRPNMNDINSSKWNFSFYFVYLLRVRL